MTNVKICGLRDPDNLKAAIEAGARFAGFVFHPASPRHVDFQIAQNLARILPTGVRSVGLVVDPSDDLLDQILGLVQLDMIQLHGSETPGRIAAIKARFHIQVMKAISVSNAADLDAIAGFEAAADWLLFDAKSTDPLIPGGSGQTFDWNLLAGRHFAKPWMLAGGLSADNVGQALSILKPDAVDVSSGVETTRGQKDPQKIRQFMAAVKAG
jgi:phosphoribosylanthranilate isomerase